MKQRNTVLNFFKSKWPVFAVWFYLVYLFFTYPSYKNNRSIIHDVTSYYGYLPALFIYHDIDFGFADTMPHGEPLDALWYNSLENGQRFQKMTVGLAYFYAPGFFIADAVAAGNPQFHRNGFSKPYQMAMAFNTLLVGMLSVWLMWVCLQLFFSRGIAGAVLLLVFGATNLPYYISMAPGLSHPYSFLLLLLQLWAVLKFNQQQSWRYLLLLSISTAWVVLIRPTNIFPAMLPLFLINYHLLGRYAKKHLHVITACIIAVLLVWLPQFIYWHHVSGKWLFYSYDNERFFFTDPKIIEGLFGFRKGWFIYTPLALLALLGLFIPARNRDLSRIKIFVLATLPVFVYVVFSWWCWWYGGSFGSRVMIEYWVALSLLLGMFIRYITQYRAAAISGAVLGLFLLILTGIQLKQYAVGLLHWDSMTPQAYKAIFMKTKLPAGYEQMLETPDYEAAKKGVR